MRMIFGLVLLLGIGLAGFAVYMARGYVSQYQSELAAERAARSQIVVTKEVYVMKNQFHYGQRITPDDVKLVAWPENGIPKGAFVKGEEPALFPEGETRPRSALRAMEADEAVMTIKVTKPGEDAGVASRLTAGMRAFAIQVDVQTGVSGFLRPGDRVDIYWTGSLAAAEGTTRSITKLIETGVTLIAVDQSADEDNVNPMIARTVTVEATPQQVAALAQAQSSGRLALSLVGVEDKSVAVASDVDQKSLLGIEEQKQAQVEATKVCTVKTRRGAEMIETPISCTN